MVLWKIWWSFVMVLRPAFSRTQTFLWFTTALAGYCVRCDFAGVTSIIRSLGLEEKYYDRLLDMFHSRAIKLDVLTQRWTSAVLRLLDPFLLRSHGRLILLADGIKIAKSGRKMPGVKKLHQQSESNTKPEFIFGHSCQAIAIAVTAMNNLFALPLASRIHEGVVFSNRDQRTLLDKLVLLFSELAIQQPCLMIADAYYASAKIIKPLLKDGHHLLTTVRSNAVAYQPVTPPEKKPKGCPKKYGEKVVLKSLFNDPAEFIKAASPLYGEKDVILQYRVCDLMWKPAKMRVRFILVKHPTRGKKILMCTDLTLDPVEIIRLYGIRFKIEVGFKQAVHTVGTYTYHFWMKAMKRLPRRSGNQYMHKESCEYREAVRRKIRAYHCHIQLGIIAQGLLQAIAVLAGKEVWRLFGSWLRTVRPGNPPSEQVVVYALRNSLPDFLMDSSEDQILVKFIRSKIDLSRAEGFRLAS